MKLAVTRKTITWSGVVIVLVAVLAINGGAWLLERALMLPVNAYIRDRTLAFLQEKNLEGLVITFPKLDLSLVRRRLFPNVYYAPSAPSLLLIVRRRFRLPRFQEKLGESSLLRPPAGRAAWRGR